MTLREAIPADNGEVATLNDLAFGGPDEAHILGKLREHGDDVLSLVKEKNGAIIGHIQFFKIKLDGRDIAAGLGPMSVHPEFQKRGYGGALIRRSLDILKPLQDQSIIFVLGHPDYYPRFGFSAALAGNFQAPWSGPAFMALSLSDRAPQSGALTYPKAFF